MPFNIIRNDITKLEVDAIVNATNPQLMEGGGVCGAIFNAAGSAELSAACKKIGFCNTGDAVITKGFNLPARFIIHTVGPVYGEDPQNEEQLLYSCYRKSLELAKKKRLSSVAFPLISSGIFGYPKAEAIKIATRAIKDFLARNEMQIYLVVYDGEAFAISGKFFSAVESYIDERMVKPDRRPGFKAPHSAPRVCYDLQAESCIDEYTEKPDTEREFMASMYGAPSVYYEGEKCTKTKKRSLSELVNKKVETFSEMLLRMIDEKGMTDVEVYKRANIDRKLFSKIRKKDYTPKKVTIIALAIGLRLNMDETEDLLRRGGFAFSECNKFDVIIEYFLENAIYDIFEINETLFAFEQPLLGA